jgi:flagellin
MIINTNMGSSTAARILANNTAALQKSLKRLSTGSRIADLQDDAAGSAVAQKHSAQITRIGASRNNVSNMISFSQTQDGYMEKVASALERMSELAMLATDNTKSNTDLQLYSKEFVELQSFISSVGEKTFNGTSLFSATSLDVTVGTTDNGSGVTVSLTGADLKSDADYGVARSTTMAVITTAANASTALQYVQSAISQLATDRATVGANMSRLESEKATLAILQDNIRQAKSRIIDVDVAEESANFARQQILVQSGTAMLAQANMIPQNVLRLIGG